ncbi:MAG: ATP-dependent RNA helicase dbp6 [Icmadophila ericetorum]|nr:ATP-dependent RNA helicase dbp6 [Icmadophila ericetorum]
MANLFYNRYIPPTRPSKSEAVTSKKDTYHSEDNQKKQKKRKRDVESDEFGKGSAEISSTTLPLSQKKKAMKSKKQKSEIQPKDALVEAKGENFVFLVRKENQKRVTSVLEEEAQNKELDGSLVPDNPDAVTDTTDLKSEKKKKRKKQKSVTENSAPGSSSVAPLQAIEDKSDPKHLTKHSKIKTKFEKAAKISTNLLKKFSVSEDPSNIVPQPGALSPTEVHGLVPLPQPEDDSPPSSEPSFSALPKWLEDPIVASSSHIVPFQELGLNASTVSSLSAKGYGGAFAVQSTVLPMFLGGPKTYGGDLCISAATGSGKTLAYCLPMVESLREKSVRCLRGLIVVPTRELVAQVRETLQICISGTSLQVGTAVGSKTLKGEQEILMRRGQRYDPEGWLELKKKAFTEEEDLMDWDWDSKNDYDIDDCLVEYVPEYNSNVDILICTPGRLVDHMRSTKGFTLDDVQWLIIDEADRLLDESFQQWVDIVIPALEKQPPPEPLIERFLDTFRIRKERKVRKIILSATMTKDIGKLMALKLKKPRLVVLENDGALDPAQDTSNSKLSTLQVTTELPELLKETAIMIPNVDEKPLYLVYYISQDKDLQLSQAPERSSLLKPNEFCSDDTDSAFSSSIDSSDENSSSSSSTSSSNFSSNLSPSPLSTQYPNSPNNRKTPHGTLIFTKSNESALRLCRLLALLRPHWTPHIAPLTKSTATSTSRRTLASFRRGQISILVASDRASRGLDIPDLKTVINYDMPGSLVGYVHRVGRTARAGRGGGAATFVGPHEGRWFWNEIARAGGVRRAKKVNRVEYKKDLVRREDREEYEIALSKLGEAARGGASRGK